MTDAAASVPLCVARVCVICSPTSRGPRATSAGFHQSASEPVARATAAWPMPTDRAPIGSRKSRAPCVAPPVWAPAVRAIATHWNAAAHRAHRRALPSRRGTLERCCLVDQHDRNVVPDRVAQLARMTQQSRFGFTVLELSFAFRTHKDGKELLGHTHDDRSSGMLYPKRWSARIFRRQLGSTLTQRSR